MADAKPLRGQVAIITGASRGIGREVALTLAGAGSYCALLVDGNAPSLNARRLQHRRVGQEHPGHSIAPWNHLLGRQGGTASVSESSILLPGSPAVAKDTKHSRTHQVEALGVQALPFQCDVRDDAQVDAMVQAAVDKWGR